LIPSTEDYCFKTGLAVRPIHMPIYTPGIGGHYFLQGSRLLSYRGEDHHSLAFCQITAYCSLHAVAPTT